jgi:pyruvate dehydrogenase E2 component (dihydrolipoamide acetyltransferase)
MATDIKMPQLSDTMSAGKILTWRVAEGATVKRGDILAEVETDKANLEIESFFNGTLLKIMVPAGSNAKVGEIIAVIGQPGEAVGTSSSAPAAPPTPASSNAAAVISATPTPAAVITPTPSAPLSLVTSVTSQHRIKASPLAKKVAEQLQVNLAGVQGTGPQGRIVRRDVEAAAGEGATATVETSQVARQAPATPTVATVQTEVTGGTLTPLSRMRETIARRMQESVTTAPHFYVTTSVNMGEAMRLREVLKERPDYKGVSINHLVIKAVAYGLKHVPAVNAAMRDGQLYQPHQINIGIITSLDGGLIIPVLKEVDAMSLKDVVFEAKAAIDRARAGRPSASDLSGGTFSISNMGMFDVENFTAIINPGQGGILAVSSTKQQPVVQNGQIVIGHMMKATVSVDHRIIDGVMASTFLKHFKDALEIPALLMA